MLRFFLQRALGAVPTLLLLVTLAFLMMRLAPGGPFATERQLSPEAEANLMRVHGLDRPLHEQYLTYLGNLARGEFGPSIFYTDQSVTDLIRVGFPVSLTLGSLAMLLALALGVALGSVAALRRNTRLDHALMAGAMTGISVPNFVVAPLLVLVFSIYLGWLPASGMDGGSLTVRSMLLPVIALALPQVAYIARLTRASVLEVLRSGFIRTAHAKGLPERLVVVRHVLKPALLPVVSYLGPATAALITGSVVIEEIFSIPGLGRYFVQGALNRDYTLVMGVVVFYGALIILFNFLVDVSLGLLDPRVRRK